MKKQLFSIILLIVLALSSGSCLALSEQERRDYGLLESAVTFSSDKVIGEHGDSIPDDFKGREFIAFVKDKIPEDYYEALGQYDIKVVPMGSYYLLYIYDDHRKIILFDYSCTPEVDGPVLLDADKYDFLKVESFNKCKTQDTGKD